MTEARFLIINLVGDGDDLTTPINIVVAWYPGSLSTIYTVSGLSVGI